MLIIDRFEGDYAVCEDDDGYPRDIAVSLLPEGARVGDVLLIIEDKLTVDMEETKRRREMAHRLLEDLWE